jgi:hypothetical protein
VRAEVNQLGRITTKMKKTYILSAAALLAASMAVSHAQTTLAQWTFTATASPPDNTPAPSGGVDVSTATATELGMNNSYTYNGGETGPSVASSDVTSASGDSLSSGFGWRVRGNGNTAGPVANGWNSQAPIGTQGAQFLASTLGYSDVLLSFDLQTTKQAENNLEVLYTLDGSAWQNATITSAGSGVNGGIIGKIETGSASDANTVNGSYLSFNYAGAPTANASGGYDNQIQVNFGSIADNDANFGVEIVNASTGADDVGVGLSALNNSSGNWRYDNVIISAVPVPEPGTLALAGLGGLSGLLLFRRSRKA